MKRERYRQTVRETSVSVAQSEIQAVRTKDITKTAIRVYDGEHIGIAGTLGEGDERELATRAEEALARGLEYPFEPMEGGGACVEVESGLSESGRFVAEMEAMLSELGKRRPDFIFSNKLNLSASTVELENDNGLDFTYRATVADLGLLIKERGSAGIMDAFAVYQGTEYDRETFLSSVDMICDAFLRPADIEDGEYPVLFLTFDQIYAVKMSESLNGLLYGSGGSLFSGKLGQRLFSEDLTIIQSRSPEDEVYVPFFDLEGAANPGYRIPLVRRGVFERPYTDRGYALEYGLQHTGAASGEYDSVPDIGAVPLVFEDNGKTVKEILDGRAGILVLIASGGDFTPDGTFASPVQLSYLYDGERLIGRLPPLGISSHLYDMFGRSFMGVSSDSLIPNFKTNMIVMNMQAAKD